MIGKPLDIPSDRCRWRWGECVGLWLITVLLVGCQTLLPAPVHMTGEETAPPVATIENVTTAESPASATVPPRLVDPLRTLLERGRWERRSTEALFAWVPPQTGVAVLPAQWNFRLRETSPTVRSQSPSEASSTTQWLQLAAQAAQAAQSPSFGPASPLREPPRVVPIVSGAAANPPTVRVGQELVGSRYAQRAAVAETTIATPPSALIDSAATVPATPAESAAIALPAGQPDTRQPDAMPPETKAPVTNSTPVEPSPEMLDMAPYEWLWKPSAAAPSDHFRHETLAALTWLAEREESPAAVSAAILLAQVSAPARQSPQLRERLALFCGASVRLGLPGAAPAAMLPEWQGAAAEAWVRCLTAAASTSVVDPVQPVDPALPVDPVSTEQALIPAGQLLACDDLPLQVRITLWGSLAQQIPPLRVPRLAMSLSELGATGAPQSERTPLLLAEGRGALEACLLAGLAQPVKAEFVPSNWPRGIWEARLSPDPLVRRLVGRWSSVVQHPDAIALLRQQGRDADADVKTTALGSLGLSTDPAALAELQRVIKQEGEVRRALAIESLGLRHPAQVLVWLQDESPRVRGAIARVCSAAPSHESGQALQELVTDRAPDVQLAAAGAVQDWPTELALPILLKALEWGSLSTRQTALQQVRSRLEHELDFPVDGTLSQRRSALLALQQREGWGQQGVISQASHMTSPVPAVSAIDVTSVAQEFLASTDPQQQADLLEQLQRWGETGAVVLEQSLATWEPADRQRVLSEVLAVHHPMHRALKKLSLPSVQARRAAARELSQLSASFSWTPVRMSRLAEQLSQEQDRVVWQEALQSIARDPLSIQQPVLLQAIHHPWPDVRLAALGSITARPEPLAGLWIVPLLSDEAISVQLAAIHTAGLCGHPAAINGLPEATPARPGLRSLLTHPSAEIRQTSLAALARLHDDLAIEELVRQTYSETPSIRLFAVESLGASGDPRAAEAVLRLLWTERDGTVQQAALHSLPLLLPQAAPAVEEATGVGLAHPSSMRDKVAQWQAWWQEQSRSAAR